MLFFITGPPAFKVKPANQTLSSGETILLQCEVIGTNNPTVSWEKDGEIIKSAEHYVIKEDGLQLNSVTTEDSGTYKCIGSNREGVVESVAYINVEGKHGYELLVAVYLEKFARGENRHDFITTIFSTVRCLIVNFYSPNNSNRNLISDVHVLFCFVVNFYLR